MKKTYVEPSMKSVVIHTNHLCDVSQQGPGQGEFDVKNLNEELDWNTVW